MTTPGESRFPFGSRLSLDLTWTLRFRSVQPTELLVTCGDLHDWAEAAALPVNGRPTQDELEHVRALREAVYGAACAVIEGRRIATADRETINDAAASAVPPPRLTADGASVVSSAVGGFAPIVAMLARDAIDVLGRRDGRLRRCADDRCSLVFYDGSRPGQRRWCAAARCGNRANTRAYRSRRMSAP